MPLNSWRKEAPQIVVSGLFAKGQIPATAFGKAVVGLANCVKAVADPAGREVMLVEALKTANTAQMAAVDPVLRVLVLGKTVKIVRPA